jgi:hypothetical protein
MSGWESCKMEWCKGASALHWHPVSVSQNPLSCNFFPFDLCQKLAQYEKRSGSGRAELWNDKTSETGSAWKSSYGSGKRGTDIWWPLLRSGGASLTIGHDNPKNARFRYLILLTTSTHIPYSTSISWGITKNFLYFSRPWSPRFCTVLHLLDY